MSGISFYDELESSKLSAAFCELALEEAEVDFSAVKADCDAATGRMLKGIKRELRRVKRRSAMKKAGQIVSVLLILAFVAAGATIAASGTVRSKVVNVIVDMDTTDEKISVYPGEYEEVELIPGWWIPFYPTYIPDGLNLIAENAIFSMCYQHYETEDAERYLQFMFKDSSVSNTTYFTEDSNISDVMIGNKKATLIETLDLSHEVYYRLLWYEGNFEIYVCGNYDKEEMIKIAEMIKPIKVPDDAYDISLGNVGPI